MRKSAARNCPILETLESRLLLSGGVSGTILNSITNQPVVGLSVTLYEGNNTDSANADAWNWITSVTTDSQGRYQASNLDARDYRVRVEDGSAAGNGTPYIGADLFNVVVLDGSTTTGMNIKAMQAGKITGHVYNAAGSPIAGAQVLVVADYTQDSSDDWHTATTDSSGQYVLYLAPTGQQIYPVRILYAPAPGTSDGHQNCYADQIAPGLYSAPLTGTAGPDFHLVLGGSIHGTALTSDGAPVANQNDVIEPDTPIANGMLDEPDAGTDSNGEFWVDGLPAGTNYLQTDDWGWDDFSSNGAMYAWGNRNLGPFTVTAGQVLDIGTLTVPQAGTIRGVITDATGTPIVGADVEFRGIDANGGTVHYDDSDAITTDALGQYYCNWLPAGQYAVQVSKDGWVPYTSSTSIVVGSGDVEQQDIVLQPSATGVQVSGTITNYLDFAPRNSSGVVLPYNLIDNGDYVYGDNGPNGPAILAYNASQSWTPADMLQPDRSFTAMTNLSDGYKDYFAASATPAGRYTMTLPTSAQTLQAIGPVNSVVPGGWWSALLSDPVTVSGTAGQSLTDTFTIPKGTATISGDITVPAGYGNIISNGFLFLKPVTGNNSFFGRAVGEPDPAGHYVLSDIPVGTYYLYSYGQGLAPWVSSIITVAAGQTVTENVTMDFGGVVSGTVTADGVPLAGAAVSSQNTGFSAITDSSGNYLLTGLLTGGDTLTVSKAGLVPQTLDVNLAADEQQTQNVALSSHPASITGLVEKADTSPINGATVVAYNTVTGEQHSTTTVNGQFTFAGLPSGTYVLGATADGMTTATYPGGAGTLTLDPDMDKDLSSTPIVLSTVGPTFSVSSSVAAGKLSITFHTDMALKATPTVSLVSGGGTLGAIAIVNTTTYTCTYTPAAGDTLAQISIAESAAKPVVSGAPATKTFGFDVAPTLVAETGTTFYNAEGASSDIMGTQDNSTVYVPPFALAGGDAASAITLTATRYGDPGAQLGDAKSVTGVYEFNFDQNGQPANVTLAHDATVTLTYKLPAGMTEAEFESTLKVGFKNDSLSPPQWVWNDMADSNPSSGISDIRVNAASNTITFKASHFTAFAAATDSETLDVTTTGKAVTYTDWDGTKVTVTLAGGQGLLHFTGIGMASTTGAGGIPVTGTSLKLDTVTLSGTTAASTLTFATVGGTTAGTSVGAITGTPLSLLAASTVTLDGTGISIPTGEITTIQLAGIDNGADITMGAAAKAVTLTCGPIGDGSSISVAGAILSLTASRWAGGTLSADSLAGLTVNGDCLADLTLAGAAVTAPTNTLGTTTIKGAVGAGTWDVTGGVGSVTITGAVGTSGGAWTLKDATTVAGLALGDVADGIVTASGSLGTVSAKRWLAGSITGASVTALNINGSAAAGAVPAISGDFLADLTLSGAGLAATASTLGSAAIKGNVGANTWAVTGAVGAVTVAGTVGTSNGAWTLQHAAKITGLTLGDVIDGVVMANNSIGTVTAKRWQAGAITASSLTTLTMTGSAAAGALPAVSGDFLADLTLTAQGLAGTGPALGTATIKGNMGATTWDVSGKVSNITVGGTVGTSGNPWTLQEVTSLGALTLGDVADAAVTVYDDLGTVTAKRWQAGTLQANSLATLNITGSAAAGVVPAVSGDFLANLMLTGAGLATSASTLGTATVKGNVGTGTWDVTGKVGTVTVGGTAGVSGTAWTLLHATNVTSLALGDVVNASVTATGSIGSVTAKRWQGGSLEANSLTTLSVAGAAAAGVTPAIRGDLGPNLMLHGRNLATAAKTLGTVTVQGNLQVSTWDIGGAAGDVTVSGTVSGWTWGGHAGAPVTTSTGALKLGNVSSASVVIRGPVGAVSAIRWEAGLLQATRGTTLTITGQAGASPISGDFCADLILTQPTLAGATPLLTAMTVAGLLEGSTVTSAGPLGAITVGGMQNSAIGAGVKSNLLGPPATAGDFNLFTTSTGAALCGIASFTIKGITGQTTNLFSNAILASYAMGTVVLTGVNTDNSAHGDATFGVYGHSVASYKRDLLAPVALTGPKADTIEGDFVLRMV